MADGDVCGVRFGWWNVCMGSHELLHHLSLPALHSLNGVRSSETSGCKHQTCLIFTN